MSTLQVEGIRNAAATSDAITLAANNSASANLSNYGRRNWIVNGGFEVHQRKDTTHSYSWCGDRFQHRTGSSAVIAQSSTVPEGFNKSMSLTASSGTLSLAWNTVLEAGNNLSGTAIGGFYANNTKWTVSIWSTRVPNVRVDFTDGFGPTNPVSIVAYTAMTSTGETSNGFTRYKHTFDIGSNNPVSTSKGLHIGWQLATAAADVKFTGAQLEKGEYCGPYEHLSYGEYLAQCQRYLYKTPYSGYYVGAGNGSTNMNHTQFTFPVAMRAQPAGMNAVNVLVITSSNYTSASSKTPTIGQWCETGAALNWSGITGATDNRMGAIMLNGSGARLTFDSEFG